MSESDAKQMAGIHAVKYIEDGMVVGLGTGSTAYYAIQEIGKRVKQGLNVKGVPTSIETARIATEAGIPLLENFEFIDVAIDGADEVCPYGNLIKGGGGALFREKIVAAASSKFIVVVNDKKNVENLGKFPLPVETLPFGCLSVKNKLEEFGCTTKLRLQESAKPFVTDNGNYIIDCLFGKIDDPEILEFELNAIPGVIENGLFIGSCDLLLTGTAEGVIEVAF